MIELLRRIAYQPVRPTMLGPYWSAIGAGFLILKSDGRIHITEAGLTAVAETRRAGSAGSSPRDGGAGVSSGASMCVGPSRSAER